MCIARRLLLENLGMPPDMWVKNSPMDDVRKFDRELKTAIEEAVKMRKAGAPKQITSNN